MARRPCLRVGSSASSDWPRNRGARSARRAPRRSALAWARALDAAPATERVRRPAYAPAGIPRWAFGHGDRNLAARSLCDLRQVHASSETARSAGTGARPARARHCRARGAGGVPSGLSRRPSRRWRGPTADTMASAAFHDAGATGDGARAVAAALCPRRALVHCLRTARGVPGIARSLAEQTGTLRIPRKAGDIHAFGARRPHRPPERRRCHHHRLQDGQGAEPCADQVADQPQLPLEARDDSERRLPRHQGAGDARACSCAPRAAANRPAKRSSPKWMPTPSLREALARLQTAHRPVRRRLSLSLARDRRSASTKSAITISWPACANGRSSRTIRLAPRAGTRHDRHRSRRSRPGCRPTRARARRSCWPTA